MPVRILLVDDDDSVRRSLVRLLRTYYDILEADCAARALQLARDSAPDVVLMDLLMPGINGIEAARELKHDERTTAIPIIALTASHPPPAPDRALFADVLGKPCPPGTLLDAIERARQGS